MQPLATVVSVMLSWPRPRPQGFSLTADQWRQDLQGLVNELKANHRNPYHYTSKAEFDNLWLLWTSRSP